MNNRFAILDANRVLQGYYSTSDQSQLAANIPPGGSSVRTDDVSEPGVVRYDTANRVVPIATPPETDAHAFSRMIDSIDDERETLMMAQLTAGGAKKYEYAAKLREWQDYTTLSLASILAMTLSAQQTRWPWAMAEVADSGDTLAVVMGRYKDGMDRSALARKIAARAQTLKRRLKAAQPADRAAIYNSRAWPTS